MMKSYSIILGLFFVCLLGCQKGITIDLENDTIPPVIDTVGVPSADYTYYYQATIDGVSYKEIVTEDNGYEAGSGASGTNEVVVGGGINLVNTAIKGTSFGISKGTLYDYLSLSNSDFKAFFKPGTYPYSPKGYAGVTVGWTDTNGIDWSTEFGSANQTGSVFKIIGVKDVVSVIDYYVQVTVEFSCKIYNDAGDSKLLTNGKAVVAFGKI